MDNKIIQEYIDNGQELELLDKLNSYVITEVDRRFFNVVKILVFLQEKAKIDWTQANRALVDLITKMLGKVFDGKGTSNLDNLMTTIEEGAAAPYQNISYLGRQMIIGIEDKDSKFSDGGISQENLDVFQEAFQSLNIKLLRKAIEEKHDYSVLVILFYNCVDHLGEERRTFLLTEALDIFKNHVHSYPNNYLKTFIRPYYSGTTKNSLEHYFHVPEPFHQQIFGDKFENFLDSVGIEEVEPNLVNDIRAFYLAFKNVPDSSRDRIVILYSAEMQKQGLEKPLRMLQIKSTLHEWVRAECKPPSYLLDDKKQNSETFGF